MLSEMTMLLIMLAKFKSTNNFSKGGKICQTGSLSYLHDDAASGAAANGDVEEALGVGHVGICGISGDFTRVSEAQDSASRNQVKSLPGRRGRKR